MADYWGLLKGRCTFRLHRFTLRKTVWNSSYIGIAEYCKNGAQTEIEGETNAYFRGHLTVRVSIWSVSV